MKPKKSIIAPEVNKKITLSEKESQTLDTDQSNQARLLRAELRKKFVTLSDQLAESLIYYRNYKYQNSNKLYPNDLDCDLRFVTKCYPYAKGGLLLVDEPRDESQKQKCLEKQEKLKALNFRHVIIEEGTTLYDCFEQLGEL